MNSQRPEGQTWATNWKRRLADTFLSYAQKKEWSKSTVKCVDKLHTYSATELIGIYRYSRY